MVRFTIRELKSIVKSGHKQGFSKNQIQSARAYLQSEDAKKRIARGKVMAIKRRKSRSLFGGFRI